MCSFIVVERVDNKTVTREAVSVELNVDRGELWVRTRDKLYKVKVEVTG